MLELRAVIIDDEIDGMNGLKLLIEKYLKNVKVIAETTVPQEGLMFIENYMPDVVFLDINMPGMNGLELSQKLTNKKFKLIFTTAHEKHALSALKLGATDYLLKPIDADELILAIEKVRNIIRYQMELETINNEIEKTLRSSVEKNHRIQISDKEGTEFCYQDDIVRLEARSNYTWVVFKDKKNKLVSKTLKDFEKLLCGSSSPFVRVHQSNIINLNHCLRFRREKGGMVEMFDESLIGVSSAKKDEFMKRIKLFNLSLK